MRYQIRRKDKEIVDTEQLKKILKKTSYVTVAMFKDNEPYLVSLSHGYDEERHCIYFHCASEGKKLDYIRANPVVWGQAILDYGYHIGECSHLYASVMFKGKVGFIDDEKTKLHAFRTMVKQLEPKPELIIDNILNNVEIKTTIVGKINIKYMTGKKSAEVTI